MTGAAQLEFLPGDGANLLLTAAEPASDLRRQAAASLAAHRQRRGRTSADAVGSRTPGAPKRSSIAAAVAERYAQTPSYRAFLADHAKRAMEEAAAAAEVAMRNAEAVVAAHQQLLGELELWNAPQEFTAETGHAQTAQAQTAKLQPAQPTPAQPRPSQATPVQTVPKPTAPASPSPANLTVRLYEDLAPTSAPPAQLSGAPLDTEAFRALDEEIAFRQSPVFEDYKAYLQREAEPPIPLPANLLEFPRQLVAPRKARPRLAEGPLLDDPTPTLRQLRIFEVEAGQISTIPALPSTTPEWASIHLDAHTITDLDQTPEAPLLPSILPPHAAPFGLRAMAFLLDAGLVLAALVLFAGVFARVAGQIPGGWPGLAALAGIALVLHILYGLFFFTLSDQTPGMRYARIGFCSFTDENPPRAALRKRVLAQLLALAPLGMGLLWALLDEDRLGWHDRLSRMYQRAY